MADSKEAVAIRPTEKVADDEAIVQDWTVEEERAVLRKIDMRVVPMCLILYLFSFLDRVNIGNARVIGLNRTGLGNMERDLGMSGNDYNIAVSVFYITYCLFEPFSNVILNRSSPSVWISRIAFTWGICATALGGVQNLAGLLAVRLLLGLCEAGLVPGISYYCSFWYRREELASRIALWFGGAGLATASPPSSPMPSKLVSRESSVSRCPTIFIGVLVYFVLPDEPLTAKFMTDRERHIAVNRLKLNAATRGEKHFEKSEIFKVLANPIVWVFALSNFLSITPGYAYSLFLPTIIVGLGKSGLDANLFSAPPFVLSAIATIIGAFLSDRFKTRSYFIILGSALSLAGFAALSVVRDPNQAYGLLFLASLGGVAFPVGWAWLSNNIASHTGRALALGGISGQIYRTEDRPWYGKGHAALRRSLLSTLCWCWR
ncbi:major facilitator superfamily domain-containing protein [Chytridium lagenaria]|nr:major facilitator superfamily domain-containing protein [Chytridium lagenaria]